MPRRARRFAAVVLSLVSGCASYRAVPLDTAAELDALRGRSLEGFVVERVAPGENADASGDRFDLSDGLNEAEVVSVALTLNPDLRARRAEVGEARAGLITAGLWPNPEVGVSPKWGIGGASGVSIDADALFQLLRPGERDARRQAGHARVDEVQAGIVAEEFKLAAEVRAQRVDVLAAQRLVALMQQVVGLRESVLDLVRRQQQIGEGTKVDLYATELEVGQARRDLRRAEADLDAKRRELNRLMGLPPGYSVRLSGLGEPLKVTVFADTPDDDELDRRLLAGRPELRAGEAAYRRAEHELRLAVIQQYPRLGVGPAFERELEGEKGLGLALSLELPVFNQNQGGIAEKRAARDRARAEHVALLHRLKAEAFTARAELRAARQEIEVQERDILPLLDRNRELLEGAFRARQLNVINWIAAQQRAVDAQREYAESLVRYQRAVIRLETAVGQPLSPTTTTRPTTKPT